MRDGCRPLVHAPGPGKVVAVLIATLLVTPSCGTLSVEEERKLGEEVRQQLEEEFTLLQDSVSVDYVRELGRELVQAAQPSPFDFRFESLTLAADALQQIAFALPLHTHQTGQRLQLVVSRLQRVDDRLQGAQIEGPLLARIRDDRDVFRP